MPKLQYRVPKTEVEKKRKLQECREVYLNKIKSENFANCRTKETQRVRNWRARKRAQLVLNESTANDMDEILNEELEIQINESPSDSIAKYACNIKQVTYI